MEMCRACLVTDTKMVPFDEYFVINYNILTNLDVKLCDGLPQHTCRKCLQTLKFFIDFRSKAISSESSLKGALQNIKQDDGVKCEQIIDQHNDLNVDDKSFKFEIKTENAEETIFNPCDEENFQDFSNDDTYQYNVQLLKESLEDHIKDEPKSSVRNLRSHNKKKLKNKETFPAKTYKVIKTKKCKTEIVPEIDDTVLSCGLCIKMFSEASALKTHLETHQTSLQCKICQDTFTSWPEMFGHRMQHLPTKQRRCHLCNKHYLKTYTLEFHYLKEHGGAKSQEISLKCNTCSKTYANPYRLRKHILSVHRISITPYICDYCSKKCKNKQALTYHMASHTNAKRFTCNLCDFSCNYSSNLKAHVARKHSPEKCTCKRCDRVFVNKSEHDNHISKCMRGMEDFMCSFCGKQFTSHKSMKRHLRTHNPEHQYKCDRCPITYRTKQALRVHQSRHDGIPTYKCDYCPRTFYASCSRIKHHRKHTGEKPYVCHICGRGFAANYTRKFHMRTHGVFLINHVNKDLENKKKDE